MMANTKEQDLARLALIDDAIQLLKRDLDKCYEERVAIWNHRLNVAKDSKQAELARASNVGRADVVQGIRRRSAS